MTITEALEELQQSPGLLDHIARLEQIVKDERKRRQQFYRDVTADQKAEFINGRVIIHSPARRLSPESDAFHHNRVEPVCHST